MKISVALCTYNGEKYLAEQLESFSAQTRLPDELVVCDDRSQDATVAIVRDFAAAAPFPVHLHVNETNLRVIKNFDKAISLSTGDIIALSDQDDVWHADKLKIFEEVFDAKPHVGLVFCDANLVDENLNPLGYTNWECTFFDQKKQELLRTKAAFELLLRQAFAWGCLSAFRAEYKPALLPIPDVLPNILHDGWISYIIAAAGYIEPIPQCLVEYRQHTTQQLGQPPPSAHDASVSRLVWQTKNRTLFEGEILRLTTLRGKLERMSESFAVEDFIKIIDSRLRHYNNRQKITESGASRIFIVAEELFSMRYHKYSNGFGSAVKDLLLA